MDGFTTFGDSFEEILTNIRKFLKKCIDSHLSLRNGIFVMIMTEGIVLGHHVYAARI